MQMFTSGEKWGISKGSCETNKTQKTVVFLKLKKSLVKERNNLNKI